jgi:hypothetical protein
VVIVSTPAERNTSSKPVVYDVVAIATLDDVGHAGAIDRFGANPTRFDGWSTVTRVAGVWSSRELDALVDDVLVDAYGDAEQLGSFECVFGESGLPVAAEVLGMPCTLLAVEFDGDERTGLVAVVVLDGQRRRVGLLDIVITEDSHAAARLLAAFRRWWVPES